MKWSLFVMAFDDCFRALTVLSEVRPKSRWVLTFYMRKSHEGKEYCLNLQIIIAWQRKSSVLSLLLIFKIKNSHCSRMLIFKLGWFHANNYVTYCNVITGYVILVHIGQGDFSACYGNVALHHRYNKNTITELLRTQVRTKHLVPHGQQSTHLLFLIT